MKNKIEELYREKITGISKGQFLSILVIVTLVFISGGSLFTTLFAKQQLGQVWSIYTGDHRQMAETYSKASLYPIFLSNNVDYAINNAAYELGKKGSNREWNDSNIPTEEELLSDFNQTIVAHGQYGIRSQNYYADCSIPSLQHFSIEGSLVRGGGHVFAYNMDSNTISCGTGGYESRAIDEMENFYSSRRTNFDRQEFIQNNYIPTTEFVVEMTKELRDTFNPPIYDTANETTTQCDPDNENRQEAKDEAYNSAKTDARNKIDGHVSQAVSNSDKPDYLDVTSSERASNYIPSGPANTYEVDCSLTHTHDNSSCEVEDCSGEYDPNLDYTDQHGHGGDYRGGGDGCEDYDCVSHTHDHEQDPDVLVKKKYESNVTLATYYATINVTDVDNSFPTHQGISTNIPFDYQYTDSLGN